MPKYFDDLGRTVHVGPYWTLARPALALPLQVAVAGAFLGVKLHRAPAHAWKVAVAIAAGAAMWTLFEYAVHRWLFHQTGHRVLRAIWIHAHRPHHRMRTVEDPHHRALHPFVAIPALLPCYLAFLRWPQTAIPMAVLAGFALGYCAYELQHYLFHATDVPRRFAHWRWVRLHHLGHIAHHLSHPRANFGFTTYFWDRVFGTWVDVSVADCDVAAPLAEPC